MFTGIWAKIVAVLGVITGYYVIKSKIQAHKIEKLEDENFGLGKENSIEKAMDKVEAKAEKVEKQARQDFDDKDWRDKIG